MRRMGKRSVPSLLTVLLLSYFVFNNEEASKNANLAAMKIVRLFFCKF